MARGVDLAVLGEDDDGDFGVAEEGELGGFAEETEFAFGEGDVTLVGLFDSLDFDLLPPYAWPFRRL